MCEVCYKERIAELEAEIKRLQGIIVATSCDDCPAAFHYDEQQRKTIAAYAEIERLNILLAIAAKHSPWLRDNELPDWLTTSDMAAALVVPLSDKHMQIVAAELQSAADALLVERMQAVQAKAVVIANKIDETQQDVQKTLLALIRCLSNFDLLESTIKHAGYSTLHGAWVFEQLQTEIRRRLADWLQNDNC